MPETKLIICGSIAIDRIMSFPGRYSELIQPDKIDVLSISVLAETMTIAPGGVASNIGLGLAQLGDKPILLSSVGEDAADYLKELGESGIDISSVNVSSLPTASFTAFTDADNNQMSGFYIGAMGDSESLNLKAWANQDALLCLSAFDPAAMRRLSEECAGANIRLFYDPGQQVNNVSGEDLRAGIEAAEIVAVNEYERSLLCEKVGITNEELEKLVSTLITTQGDKGSIITGNKVGKPILIGSAKPSKVLDPTGAGDAYRAGFLYGYLRQWDLKTCGQLGAVIASFVLQQVGPQVKLDKTEIVKRYKETFNEEIEL